MPNVIRTVAKSTLISEYQKHCTETEFSPLSRATLFRILDIREASQQNFLHGLDNTAADGSSAFDSMENIPNSLQQASNKKISWFEETRKSLRASKKYLKIDFRVHCKETESLCSDHCHKYALSDSENKEFQELCNHQHTVVCDQCQRFTQVLIDIEQAIQTCQGFYGNDQKEDILHDFGLAKNAILAWNAHILRSENQECGKIAVLETLDDTSTLVVIDCAMTFLQMR